MMRGDEIKVKLRQNKKRGKKWHRKSYKAVYRDDLLKKVDNIGENLSLV